MARLRSGRLPVSLLIVVVWALAPEIGAAQGYKTFNSEEYGFSMQYPDTWVKIDNPPGNYYVVFQAPDMSDNFRNKLHVAAHKPVKDALEVHLEEMRNGIKDLQKASGAKKPADMPVRIVDEGEFRCDVPGAYFFVLQALEEKLKIWLDIVIVFYKHDKTLLRVSCLAPPKSMEMYHKIFNDVLVSVKFQPGTTDGSAAGQPPAQAVTGPRPAARPPTPQVAPQQPPQQPAQIGQQPSSVAPAQPSGLQPQVAPVQPPPAAPQTAPRAGQVEQPAPQALPVAPQALQPAQPQVAPASPSALPTAPSALRPPPLAPPPQPQMRPAQPEAPQTDPGAPRGAVPRGPLREPAKPPSTGIVE